MQEDFETAKQQLLKLSESDRWQLLLETSNSYPWYQIVDSDEIKQGDILESCPIFVPPSNLADIEITSEQLDLTIEFGWEKRDVIIMSQSCDMIKGKQQKLREVLLCPVWKQSKLTGHLSTAKGMEDARKGNLPGSYLLAQCSLEGFTREVRIVDFRQVHSLPIDFIRKTALSTGSRLRLLPPYREHLAQAFARYFMRVGLPLDIPPFK